METAFLHRGRRAGAFRLAVPTVVIAILLAAGSPATGAGTPPEPGPAPAPTLPKCDSPQHRQFDFWLGEWDVFGPRGKQVGTNSIDLILGGCVLSESWKGNGGVEGSSLNIYDRSDGRWHQAWVDSTGERLDLAGGFEAGRMVLTGQKKGDDGKPVTDRITWKPLSGGRVQQIWEQSKDGGRTWEVAFDGTYVPRHARGKTGPGAPSGAP